MRGKGGREERRKGEGRRKERRGGKMKGRAETV